MSFSDISDLTELSSEEEDAPVVTTAKAKTTTRSKGKTREFEISKSLRPPRTSQYSVKALYDYIVEGAIDLDPEYQRDIVWPETKQVGLIDSILHNYYIPPIVFALTAADDGDEKRTCIDGKQRLTSIQRFMDGLIPHKDSFTNQKTWYSSNGIGNRKLLGQQYRRIFANKQIVCVEYENLNDDQEREIFQRVQLGVALSAAERMQAISGVWPSLIRDVLSEVLGEDGFDGFLEWGRSRGRDFQCMTSIAYNMEKYPKHTNPTVSQLEKWLQNTKPVTAKFRESLFETFRIFVVLARDKKLSKCFKTPSRVSPAEFVMIGLLIHVYGAKLSLPQISSAIGRLRADVRDNYIDIRMNTKTMRHMFDFLTNKIKIPKSDGKGEPPASAHQAAPPKRKRAIMESDDEAGDDAKPTRSSKVKISASSPAKSVKTAKGSNSKMTGQISKPITKPVAVSFKTSTSKIPATLPISTQVFTASNLGQASASKPVRVPRISSLLPMASKPEPASTPLPPAPAALPPTPCASALPPTRELSSPPIQTLPSATLPTAVQTPVSVKHELRASPSIVHADNRSSEYPESFPKPMSSPSVLPDRLAPLRAAKAAVKLDPVASPSIGSISGFPSQKVDMSLTTHDPQPPPMHVHNSPPPPEGTPLFPADLPPTQTDLDKLLTNFGHQSQRPQLITSPSTPVLQSSQPQRTSEPSNNTPPMQPTTSSTQPAAPSQMQSQPGPNQQDSLPAKPLSPTSNSTLRKASGMSMPSVQTCPPNTAFQTPSSNILLAAPMASSKSVNATNHPPPHRPAIPTEPRSLRGSAPPPSSSSLSSNCLPTPQPPYRDRWIHPERRAVIDECRGSYGDMDVDRDRRRESDWDRHRDRRYGRDWERSKDRGWSGRR